MQIDLGRYVGIARTCFMHKGFVQSCDFGQFVVGKQFETLGATVAAYCDFILFRHGKVFPFATWALDEPLSFCWNTTVNVRKQISGSTCNRRAPKYGDVFFKAFDKLDRFDRQIAG